MVAADAACKWWKLRLCRTRGRSYTRRINCIAFAAFERGTWRYFAAFDVSEMWRLRIESMEAANPRNATALSPDKVSTGGQFNVSQFLG